MLRQLSSLLHAVLCSVLFLAHAEEGQGIIEYALIITLFVIALIFAVGHFGTTLQAFYNNNIVAVFP